ncbi:MAG: PPC domain-containing protein, partial [Sulfurovum sp.]|nr:PPC domain-containing protein [Sulfurovum sp.]
TTSGSLEVVGDNDWFKIVVTNVGVLAVETNGSLDTDITLYNASGYQIAFDDNSGSGNNAKIEKKVSSGTYYVKVNHHDSSGTGNYLLVSQFVADDHGDTKETATSINPNSNTTGSLEIVGDNDWFKIVVTNVGVLAVETNGSLDTDITLYNAGGTQVAFDDNSGSGNNAKIEKKVSSGTYYVKVNHHDSSGTGNYLLVSQFVAGDHGDTKETATSISPNSNTTGSLEIVGDNDWFKIVVTNAGRLVVETNGSLDTDITLYNAGGYQIASDDNSGSGNNAKIAKKVSSGTYYVKVKHHDSSGTGNYLFVSQFIADDHGDTKETATLIAQTKVLTLAESRRYEPFERTVPESIGFAGDEDWFKIVTTDIGNLTVKTTGSTDTGITLYDENNNEVPLDGNSTTRISGGTYSSTKGWPHTYYVRVKHRNPSGTGDYSLVVKIVSDVGGYNYATAEKIQPNSTIHAALNFDNDQDYFEINITSAGTLTVGTLTVSPKTNKDATDTYGYLYRKEDLTSLTSVDKLSSEGDTVNWIGANNNIHNDGSNRNFRIIKQVTPGIYYVRVRGYYNEFSGPDTNHLQTGEYKFYSQFVADDHGSTKETATFIDKTTEELSKTVTVPGRIGFAGDEDWFKIVTTDVGNLTVKTTGSTDTVVTLYDKNNNEVPLDGNSTTRISGERVYSPTRGWPQHTYYVRVKHRHSSGTGDYSLVVKLAFDVGGDIYARATTIQPNSTIQAAINFATDQDYFKIVLPYAGTLTVGTTGTTNTYGHLYNEKDLVSLTYEDYRDWNRTWLTSNNNIYNDASDTNFRIIKYLTAGTYYVRVRCYAQEFSSVAGAAAGEYTLYSQFDDHGNSRSTATSINPNSETEGHFERAGDEDFFKIVISHSATLTLKTTGSTDTVGTLLD